MVTSVEEESSFPLPAQNPVQGSFLGEITCFRGCGERDRTPTGISRGGHRTFAIPSSQPLPIPNSVSGMGRPAD